MFSLSLLEQLTVINPTVCHDKLVNQQFAAHSGLPHSDESSQVCSLEEQLKCCEKIDRLGN